MTSKSELIYEQIRKSRHFPDLEDQSILRFINLVEHVSHHKDEVIVNRGEYNDSIYIVFKGSVKVYADDNFLYVLQRIGDIFGEMCIFQDAPSTMTFIAEDGLETLKVSLTTVKNHPQENLHELYHVFFKWYATVLNEKLVLANSKAKLLESTQLLVEQKNIEMEERVKEQTMANEIINDAFENLRNAKIELVETKKIASMTNTFKKFVPEQFLRRLGDADVDDIVVGNAESDFVTILFSDIRDFTRFSENLSVNEVFNFLNAYLKRMSIPIHQHQGFIDKFIGDAIMAIFNIPDQGNALEAEGALESAIGMQAELIQYNIHRKKYNYPPIRIGVGIHSGPVMMGTIGSEKRMDFTVIGDAVNLASRLEGMSKFYGAGIVISQDTFILINDISRYKFRELDIVRVKGKSKSNTIFEVFSGMEAEIFDKKSAILETYYQGLIFFRMKEWQDAKQAFEKCLQIYPEDKASDIYLKRVEQLIINPPGKDWHFIYSALDK